MIKCPVKIVVLRTMMILLVGRVLYSQEPFITINEDDSWYIVQNSYYTLKIGKKHGMIKSLKVTGSDLELADDTKNYSVSFPEFQIMNDDYTSAQWYCPNSSGQNVYNTYWEFDDLIVFKTDWITNTLNTTMYYYFEADKEYFRVSVIREVVKSGLYGNFQHCAMYTSEMENSFIINYTGQIELTEGTYSGNYPVVEPKALPPISNPIISQHSLWTVFDYGMPRFWPTIAWYDAESNITVGMMILASSSNQRHTISYHGGGDGQSLHPHFVEAQINWFGKGDSECLWLDKGTTMSVELLYYQKQAHVDSLWQFNEKMLSRLSVLRDYEYHSSASPGGSVSTQRYTWRYPQVSNDFICAPEMGMFKAFSIPRSQDGQFSCYLFSLNLIRKNDNGTRVELTPSSPLDNMFIDFSHINNMMEKIGGYTWVVDSDTISLNYSVFPGEKHVKVHGKIKANTNDDYAVELSGSRRISHFYSNDKAHLSVLAEDDLLDSIGIDFSDFSGIDTVTIYKQLAYLHLDSENEKNGDILFSFLLTPSGGKDLYNDKKYKNYFEIPNPHIPHIETSVDYVVLADNYNIYSDRFVLFKLWIVNDIHNITIALPEGGDFNRCVIKKEGQIEEVYYIGQNKLITIDFPFKKNTLYTLLIDDHDVEAIPSVPESFELIGLYPNPFNSQIVAELRMDRVMSIDFKIFNLLGKEIDNFSYPCYPGTNKVFITFSQERFSSGIYILNIKSNKKTLYNKILLIR
ncbi:MAG: T9SS type A sorting domain-containing protein [Candidatus Marinimicrobia bacterium]|nr:T9SS type A sorting domain-containing protein [Candidatus Neomarinimicrobiota bacterium]